MLPTPTPAKTRPANNNGLNKGPVMSRVISINSQPIVNGRLHMTIVNWRPWLSTNQPAMGAPNKPPTADKD